MKVYKQLSFKMFLSSLLLLLLPVLVIAQVDSRYDSGLNLPFNRKAGDVNPQTGNITVAQADVSLPGRAGMDFIFARSWSLNKSNVFNMGQNSDGTNGLYTDTLEKYNHLGIGWSSTLPYIFSFHQTPSEVKNLAFQGNVYELDTDYLPIYSDNKSNIKGYDLLDMRVFTGVKGAGAAYGAIPTGYGITDTQGTESEYVLILKDNSKSYFRQDGQLMMQQDRTGLNRIWYYYQDYGTGTDRLRLVVDSIGRHIVFTYSPESTIASISWKVFIGSSTGSYDEVTRTVTYGYDDAKTAYPLIQELSGNEAHYALTTVTDVQGNDVHYNYTAGETFFSFDSSVSRARNVSLLLTQIISIYTPTGFKSKRCFEYALSEQDKTFYQGFIEYYKITRQYFTDKDSRIMNETLYRYYSPGNQCSYNEYLAKITTGNVTTTFTYTLSELKKYDNVLDKTITKTLDGFEETTDYSYTNDRTIDTVNVYRDNWIYMEDFTYDRKGNMTSYVNRRGLVTGYTYDPVFSIPTRETKILEVQGVEKTYKTETKINSIGQITAQYIYLEGWMLPVRTAMFEYDQYGNITAVTDAKHSTVQTAYDSAYNTFPVKTWQSVTIGTWSSGSLATNWTDDPDTQETTTIRTWQVFNSDGTVWLDVDNKGYAIEHYYDAYGREIRTVNPDDDDITGFEADDYTDLYTEYFQGNASTYFPARADNPGVRVYIHDQESFMYTVVDVDDAVSKITGVQGDGLGNTLEEIEYKVLGAFDETDITDPNLEQYSIKTMTYDTLGRMVGLTDPDAGTTFTPVEIHGTTVNRYDKTWLVKYDDLGRKKTVIYPETTSGVIDIKTITYDDQLNTVSTKDPAGRTVVETRDWQGNLTEILHKGFASTPAEDYQTDTYEYDLLDRKTAFTDPKGNITRYSYDERNLLTEQNFGETGKDTMSYNELSQLVKKTNRNGRTSILTYDELGRNTRAGHYITYNGDGDPSNVEEYSVQTVYDFRGNPVRVDNSSLIEYYVYDYANRIVHLNRRIKDDSVNALITGRVWSGTPEDLVFTFNYTYNHAGMMTTMTYPDGSTIGYTYDQELSRLMNIKDGTDDFVSDFQYNKSGAVTRMDYENGTWQTWQFDNRKRIKHISINNTEKEISDLTYTLSGSGNILKINDNEYGYDGFNRIISAKTHIPGEKDYLGLIRASFGTVQGGDPITVEGETREFNPEADLNTDGIIDGFDHAQASFMDPGSIWDTEDFEYDQNDNRTVLEQNGNLYTYEYGKRNRLEKIFRQKKDETGPELYVTYEYDNSGNTTKRTIYGDAGTQVITFEYNTMNRLIRTTEDSKVTEYFYDNVGNRFIKKSNYMTTIYLRHGQISVAMDIELPQDTSEELGRINRYVLADELLAGRITDITKADATTETEKSWYHLDHLNSTKCITDQDGILIVMYEYRAFGEQLKRLDDAGAETEDKAKYSYSGKELDDGTNLYYFNARYYDAVTGRFINIDPVQDGSNWYVYCTNNPLSFIDPTGLKDMLNEVEKLKNELRKSKNFFYNTIYKSNLANTSIYKNLKSNYDKYNFYKIVELLSNFNRVNDGGGGYNATWKNQGDKTSSLICTSFAEAVLRLYVNIGNDYGNTDRPNSVSIAKAFKLPSAGVYKPSELHMLDETKIYVLAVFKLNFEVNKNKNKRNVDELIITEGGKENEKKEFGNWHIAFLVHNGKEWELVHSYGDNTNGNNPPRQKYTNSGYWDDSLYRMRVYPINSF